MNDTNKYSFDFIIPKSNSDNANATLQALNISNYLKSINVKKINLAISSYDNTMFFVTQLIMAVKSNGIHVVNFNFLNKNQLKKMIVYSTEKNVFANILISSNVNSKYLNVSLFNSKAEQVNLLKANTVSNLKNSLIDALHIHSDQKNINKSYNKSVKSYFKIDEKYPKVCLIENKSSDRWEKIISDINEHGNFKYVKTSKTLEEIGFASISQVTEIENIQADLFLFINENRNHFILFDSNKKIILPYYILSVLLAVKPHKIFRNSKIYTDRHIGSYALKSLEKEAEISYLQQWKHESSESKSLYINHEGIHFPLNSKYFDIISVITIMNRYNQLTKAKLDDLRENDDIVDFFSIHIENFENHSEILSKIEQKAKSIGATGVSKKKCDLVFRYQDKVKYVISTKLNTEFLMVSVHSKNNDSKEDIEKYSNTIKSIIHEASKSYQ